LRYASVSKVPLDRRLLYAPSTQSNHLEHIAGDPIQWVRRWKKRNRPIALSITHNFGSSQGSQRDVGEAREPAPHDSVAGRWIVGSGEVATKPSDLDQIV